MSTIQYTAANLAIVTAYLNDPAVADILARAADVNVEASRQDGWSDADILGNLGGAFVTADAIRAAAPMAEPTRRNAAQALRGLDYNCNGLVPAALQSELDDLYLRVMDGVTWGRYRDAWTPKGPAGELTHYLKVADEIRAARKAAL